MSLSSVTFFLMLHLSVHPNKGSHTSTTKQKQFNFFLSIHPKNTALRYEMYQGRIDTAEVACGRIARQTATGCVGQVYDQYHRTSENTLHYISITTSLYSSEHHSQAKIAMDVLPSNLSLLIQLRKRQITKLPVIICQLRNILIRTPGRKCSADKQYKLRLVWA